MDEQDFVEAEAAMGDLISEYQLYQDIDVDSGMDYLGDALFWTTDCITIKNANEWWYNDIDIALSFAYWTCNVCFFPSYDL